MISVILFYSTFVANAFLSLTRSAVFIFVLYQFYYFFNPPTKWWGYYVPELSYSFLIVLTLIGAVALKWTSLKQSPIWSVPMLRWLYGFVLFYGLASFYAVWPDIHSVAFDAILTAAVVVTLVYKLTDTKTKLQIILNGYVASATFMGYYITQFGRTSGGRYSGGGMVDSPDANGIAAALVPALVLTLYYFWSTKDLKFKAMYVVAGAFLANGLVQIGSRGSFLGVGVGAMIFLGLLYFSKVRLENQRRRVIQVVMLGLLALPFATDAIFWERFLSIKQESQLTEEYESGSTRVYFWKAAIEMSFDKPLGAGASAFIYYSPQYLPKSVNTGRSRNRAVHSTWFEVLTEAGYPGFICFVMVVFSAYRCMKKCMAKMIEQNDIPALHLIYGISGAFISFLVVMTFLNRVRAEILYWCILFICVAYNLYYLNYVKSNSEAEAEGQTSNNSTTNLI